jgi:ABC-type polysaccharide/polyol phosphate transport system ATPase subunit
MTRGAIEVVDAARRFVVHARETRTLKELVLTRGNTGAQEVWALRGVSLAVSPGESVGLIGRNGSGKSTLLRLVAGIIKPTRGYVAVGGRVGSLLELGAGFHQDFTGRENVFLNGSIQGLRRREIRERFDEIVAFAEIEGAIDRPVRTYSSGMYMRLGFAIAAFLEADVLLLDEVFAVGDEAFQRKCFGRIAQFKEAGGTIVFVSHDASAVERLCARAVLLRDGEVAFDGGTHEAIARYRRQLAADTDPAAGGLAWGSGEAIVDSARLVDADGTPRDQVRAGDPLTVEVAVSAAAAVAPPRLQLELRDDAGALVAEDGVDLATLGWPVAGGAVTARFDVPSPPLEFGRFHVRAILEAADGCGPLHTLDDAAVFLVYPDGDGRGLVRLGGTWHAGANEGAG